MKYEAQLAQVKQLLPQAKNVLVSLGPDLSIDNLAAGLSLYLSLKQSGKEVNIITSGSPTVGQSHLFGIGDIKNTLPTSSGGNLVLTLKGVVTPDSSGQPSVPSLWKIDWAPSGSDFNLVFYPLPGQKFEPTEIIPHKEGGAFDLIFILGVVNLPELGALYNSNSQVFTNTHIVNVDRNSSNTSFGTTNILDPQASSLSEVVGEILSDLGLVLDRDISTNLLAGIYEATSNLQGTNMRAETFEVITLALKSGGIKPGQSFSGGQTINPSQPNPTSATPPKDSSSIFNQFLSQSPNSSPQPQFDLSKLFNPGSQNTQNTSTPSTQNVSSTGSGPEAVKDTTPQPSQEEIPMGEVAVTPEDDWLVPKIYKGGSVG